MYVNNVLNFLNFWINVHIFLLTVNNKALSFRILDDVSKTHQHITRWKKTRSCMIWTQLQCAFLRETTQKNSVNLEVLSPVVVTMSACTATPFPEIIMHELTVCTYPTLRVLIQGVRRYWNSSVLCDLKRRTKERRQFPYFYLGIETRVEIYNNEK